MFSLFFSIFLIFNIILSVPPPFSGRQILDSLPRLSGPNPPLIYSEHPGEGTSWLLFNFCPDPDPRLPRIPIIHGLVTIALLHCPHSSDIVDVVFKTT